jgi:glycosyltransferase involved in cell wall biosynthesis
MSQQTLAPIRRTDPCPCGSGLRYKHCCATRPAPAKQPVPDYPAWRNLPDEERESLWQTMQLALQAQTRGEISLAADLYRQVIDRAPDTFDAQHMLGVICHQTGRFREAYQRIRKALELTNWQVDTMRRNLDLLTESLLARSDENFLPATRTVDRNIPLPRLSPTGMPQHIVDLAAAIDEPLITVIVSTYAAAEFIDECLQDLIAQTVFPRLEIIVVDACSPENERQIVEAYARRYPNIRYVRTTTRIGVYAAWNLAIHAAHGRYVTPFSTNDRLRPEAYEILSTALTGHPDVAVVYGDTILTRTPHQSFANHTATGAFRWGKYTYETLTAQCTVGPHPMWRRSLHQEFGYFDEQYKALGDQEFWLRVGERMPLLHLPETTGLYWDSPDALSQSGSLPSNEWATIQGTYRGRYLTDLAEWRRRVQVARGLPWETAMFVARFGAIAENSFGCRALAGAVRDGRGIPALFRVPEDDAPLVSVIVSTFNSEAYLAACLSDLEKQTIAGSMEVIVIDSGSEQNEQAIVRQFAGRLANLIYVRTERESLYAAWNRGIGLARGRYVTNANTDDAHRVDALERLVAALETCADADVAYADYAWTSRANESFDSGQISRVVRHPAFHPADAMFYCILGCHPLWRRTLFERLGAFDDGFRAAGDYDMLLRLTANGHKPVHVPEVLSLFHQNLDGLSLSSKQALEEILSIQGRRRTEMPIERLYAVDPADARAVGQAWTALGARAMHVQVPFHDQPTTNPAYASYCFTQALLADSACHPALRNLAALALGSGDPEHARPLLAKLPDDVQRRIVAEVKQGCYAFEAPSVPPAFAPLRHVIDDIATEPVGCPAA